MTILIEDALAGTALPPADAQIVKCSWCGEIIRLDRSELALAMCRKCYEEMLGEFLRAQQALQNPHASDR